MWFGGKGRCRSSLGVCVLLFRNLSVVDLLTSLLQPAHAQAGMGYRDKQHFGQCAHVLALYVLDLCPGRIPATRSTSSCASFTRR